MTAPAVEVEIVTDCSDLYDPAVTLKVGAAACGAEEVTGVIPKLTLELPQITTQLITTTIAAVRQSRILSTAPVQIHSLLLNPEIIPRAVAPR
jgi:hypothetical protein